MVDRILGFEGNEMHRFENGDGEQLFFARPSGHPMMRAFFSRGDGTQVAGAFC